MKSPLNNWSIIILFCTLILSLSQIAVIHGIQIDRHLICETVDEVGQPLGFKNAYQFGDKQIISWVNLKDIKQNHECSWKWLGPDKNVWAEASISVSTEKTTQRVYSILDLEGNPDIFDNHGLWTVQFFIDDDYKFSDSFSIFAKKDAETTTTTTTREGDGTDVTIVQHIICSGVDESEQPWKPIDITETFLTTDEAAYSLISLDDVTPFTLVEKWIAPDGSVVIDRSSEVDWSGSGWAWSRLLISGENRQPGTWNVDVYADTTLLSTKQFTIASAGPLITIVDLAVTVDGREHDSTRSMYPGEVEVIKITLQNEGQNMEESIRVSFDEFTRSDIFTVIESTQAKDLPPGGSDTWSISLRAEKPGETSGMFRIYVADQQVYEEAINWRISESGIDLVEKSITPKEGEPVFPDDILTLTYQFINNRDTPAKNIHMELGSLPDTITLVESTAPTDIVPGATEEFIIQIKATKEGNYSTSVILYADNVVIEEGPLTIQVTSPPFWQNTLMIGIVIVILILVILAAIMLIKRRSAPTPKKTQDVEYVPPKSKPSTTTDLKFCIHCGAEIPEDSEFCGACGEAQQ